MTVSPVISARPDHSARLMRRVSPTRTALPSHARHPQLYNRVRVLLVHIPRYSIRGQARLAQDVGVSRSTISRLVSGRINPSHALAQGVTTALSRHLGRPLDPRDVFSLDGGYLTPSGCGLCGCHGCLPADAWGADDVLRPEWRGQRPGDWSFTRPRKDDREKDDRENDKADAGVSVPEGKDNRGKNDRKKNDQKKTEKGKNGREGK